MSEFGASERTAFELLYCIVKDDRQLDLILTGFLELGIRGATVVDSRGMAQVLRKDVPIFAGLSSLFPGSTTDSYLIMSVLESGQVSSVAELIEEVCGDFHEPGSGIMFTVPVAAVRGLAEEL